MQERYGQVNFWYRTIIHKAQDLNYPLYMDLTAARSRPHSEPTGAYEPESIPDNHSQIIGPMGTLWGWAAPRVFIEQLGINDQNLKLKQAQQRLVAGLDIVEQTLPQVHFAIEWLAIFAEELTKADVEPKKALGYIFSLGWLEEHNGFSTMNVLAAKVSFFAPTLWQAYNSLSPTQKSDLQIFDIYSNYKKQLARKSR